jgi:hypothetical protein
MAPGRTIAWAVVSDHLLHCGIGVIAATRQRGRDEHVRELAFSSGCKPRAHRLDTGDPAGNRAANRLGVILLKEVKAGAKMHASAVLQ